ncbi:MAG TPA: IPT/TIG domain-containing protein, partial [Candidatus Methylomirabilis sp.]|nr:IPT/TIG domain-containing protein [Candidatus Methylomirabilis sp.]
MSLLLTCMAAVSSARAQGPSMRDMFKGIPTDRCKDMGGPPPSDADGPHIDSLDVKEGRPGTVVTLKGTGFDPKGGEEIRFLLKGKDAVAGAERWSPSEIRTRVPDMGVRGKAERGWVFLVRKVGRKES